MKLASTMFVLFALFITSIWAISVSDAFRGQQSRGSTQALAALPSAQSDITVPELAGIDLTTIDAELGSIGK